MDNTAKQPGPQALLSWPITDRHTYGPAMHYESRWFVVGSCWLFTASDYHLDPERLRVRLLNAAWRRSVRVRTAVRGDLVVLQAIESFVDREH